MFVIDIKNYVPRFLMNDKNGYAIAKAIEAGLQIFNDQLLAAVELSRNIDTMPSWRLDELAWELNCIYDSSADIETRRAWIKNAYTYYKKHGTVQGIVQYMEEYFDGIEVDEENAHPFHFSIIIDGDFTKENQEWAIKAAEKAKNVRSVLDSINQGFTFNLGVPIEIEISDYNDAIYPGDDIYPGQYPET